MTRAPEAVDKAVDAVRRAEHRLVEGAEDVAAKTRKARRKLAKKAAATAKATRKDLGKAAKKAMHATGVEPKRRRRWPWLLGLLIAAAGTVVVVKSRTGQTEEVFTPEPRAAEEDEAKTDEAHQGNGRPQPAKPATQPKK